MRRKIRVLLWRYRHVLAVVLFGAAIILVVHELRPPPPGRDMVVAARPLPAGQAIRPEHVTTVALNIPPDDLLTDPTGQIPIVSIPAGLPIAASMVLGPGLADHAPPGTVVTPVHVADPAVLQLLRVGDSVDLYGQEAGGTSQLISAGALVLALPGEGSTGGLFALTTPEHTAFIAAIREETANLFTGVSGLAPFRVVVSATQY